MRNGANDLRMGLVLHYAGAHIVSEEFVDKQEFVLYFGHIFRGKDGMSAYEEAVAGGFSESREVFRERLAKLTDMDAKPTQGSKNTVSSGGVYDAIDDSRTRWFSVVIKDKK